VVFANPEVVRRVNQEFIPVALKAAMVNNPPSGIEGDLYAEIGRSKPAPQGICTVNSDGKVLTWALSFNDDRSILKFLDHVGQRYKENPDAEKPVTAERFMRFPGRQLSDVKDVARRIPVPSQHEDRDRCPAAPVLESGTLVGTIIGRPLDEDGKPLADTVRQEHYMEARLEISVLSQKQLARAVREAGGERFRLPTELTRTLVSGAFLGQLDVNPTGGVPGSESKSKEWDFHGQRVANAEGTATRIRIDGHSSVEGGPDARGRRTDGRDWEHRVTLDWHGFIELEGQQMTKLVVLASGDERLRWGNARFNFLKEPDAAHLMAGHPIDLDGGVRYGLFAGDPRPGAKSK
jgi:hypothetical protein